MSQYHLIGLGGIGMSGVAQLLLARGDKVTGTDLQSGPLLAKIRRLGGQVRLGHRADHLNGAQTIVYSSSISPANPELIQAWDRGLPVKHRGQMVADLMVSKRTVAVTGAHGKSTTAAMTAELFYRAGWDPTVLLGAELASIGGNARWGDSPHAVVEADESDGSLLWLRPAIGLITNMDEEHLDVFRNRGEILKMYQAFADRILPGGILIGCADDADLIGLLSKCRRKHWSYGFSNQAKVRADQIEQIPGGSRYRCRIDGRVQGWIQLQVPGRHNILNSLGAAAVGRACGIDFDFIQRTLSGYRGIKRRFEQLGESQGTRVVEDYGHHPTEIEATLEAARTWPHQRVVCIFQPHRYSRTKHLLNRFQVSFRGADQVILLPVYAASENPDQGFSEYQLGQALARSGVSVRQENSDWVLSRGVEAARPNDTILFMGAGSVGPLAHRFWDKLQQRTAHQVRTRADLS